MSLSFEFALSTYSVCVGLVRVPSLRIYHEGSTLIFRFLLDFSLQSACPRRTGSNRSGTRRPIAECTCMGRSQTGGNKTTRCRSRASRTTSSAIVLSHRGFSSVDILGEIPPL